MTKIKLLLSIWWTAMCLFANAQSPKVLTVDDLVRQIKEHHPVAQQAQLVTARAQAELLAAKGAFDPVAALQAENKTFMGKNYYYYTNPEIKLPTAFALDIKTGIENNGGANISPEVTTGRSSYLGIEVPLVKGLLLDKRRAVLQQAKIFAAQSQQERLAIINDLLFDVYVDYWQWAGAYQLYSIFARYVEVAKNRLRLVRIAYANGDRATIDTTEAFTQVQNYQLQQIEALQNLNNTALKLSNHLWLPNGQPFSLPPTALPDTIGFQSIVQPEPIQVLVEKAMAQNPTLQQYGFKRNSLGVERRLKFQSLLPSLNAQANLLNRDYYAFKGINSGFLENNHKFGIVFKMPLFLREGRGEYRKAKIKMREVDLELANKKWQTENKIRSYYNDVLAVQQQITLINSMYANYVALLRNEELKFAQGESSLFLVNSRETKVLELLQKKIELTTKYKKAMYALTWATGLLQ